MQRKLFLLLIFLCTSIKIFTENIDPFIDFSSSFKTCKTIEEKLHMIDRFTEELTTRLNELKIESPHKAPRGEIFSLQVGLGGHIAQVNLRDKKLKKTILESIAEQPSDQQMQKYQQILKNIVKKKNRHIFDIAIYTTEKLLHFAQQNNFDTYFIHAMIFGILQIESSSHKINFKNIEHTGILDESAFIYLEDGTQIEQFAHLFTLFKRELRDKLNSISKQPLYGYKINTGYYKAITNCIKIIRAIEKEYQKMKITISQKPTGYNEIISSVKNSVIKLWSDYDEKIRAQDVTDFNNFKNNYFQFFKMSFPIQDLDE